MQHAIRAHLHVVAEEEVGERTLGRATVLGRLDGGQLRQALFLELLAIEARQENRQEREGGAVLAAKAEEVDRVEDLTNREALGRAGFGDLSRRLHPR